MYVKVKSIKLSNQGYQGYTGYQYFDNQDFAFFDINFALVNTLFID